MFSHGKDKLGQERDILLVLGLSLSVCSDNSQCETHKAAKKCLHSGPQQGTARQLKPGPSHFTSTVCLIHSERLHPKLSTVHP